MKMGFIKKLEGCPKVNRMYDDAEPIYIQAWKMRGPKQAIEELGQSLLDLGGARSHRSP